MNHVTLIAITANDCRFCDVFKAQEAALKTMMAQRAIASSDSPLILNHERRSAPIDSRVPQNVRAIMWFPMIVLLPTDAVTNHATDPPFLVYNGTKTGGRWAPRNAPMDAASICAWVAANASSL